MELNKYSRIALVCRGGPENGPFSAQVLYTLARGFQKHDINISGIYAVSGSSATAVLGCIGEGKRLCDIWKNLTPQDIVGNLRFHKWASRLYFQGDAISNRFLINLFYKHVSEDDLDRIFSPQSSLAKIAAVDYLTAKQVIFTNRIAEHRKLFIHGVVSSMGLVPWFPALTIDDPVAVKLIDEHHPDYNLVLLIDGGYRCSLLLEEAIREPHGYDLVLVVDIHGLQVDRFCSRDSYTAAHRTKRAMDILTRTNDELELSLVERINEGIKVREQLKELAKEMPISQAAKIRQIIEQMNDGRLKLGDKHAAEVKIVSSPSSVIPFDFTRFTQRETVHIMQAGHTAALQMLQQLGLDTQGFPTIDP